MGERIKSELDAALEEHERRFDALYLAHRLASEESDTLRAELWLSGLAQPRPPRRRTMTRPSIG